MGYDSTCTLVLDGRTLAGTVLLEQQELIFRGDPRLVIPLPGIEWVEAQRGSLIVCFGGRRAVFEIGADAEKWARRIANPRSRADKLGIKPGMRVAIVNLTDHV